MYESARRIKDKETVTAISDYLKSSLDFDTLSIEYVGTHSNEGLTPIVHYAIRAKHDDAEITQFRATVYWNNATTPPTITRMDVM